jgi:hypothetical protein
MDQQQTQLNERQAVEQAQTVLEQFGTTGPQNAVQFKQCTDAIDQAAASLPPGDPVAAQLEAFKAQISTQYGYTPGATLTDAESAQLQAAESTVKSGPPGPDGAIVPDLERMITYVNAQVTIAQLGGGLSNPPQNSDWQGTTDALGNMADNVKSDAEIQMLKLQDLVSQRQQAVQLVTGMMSTEDQTVESVVKNINA